MEVQQEDLGRLILYIYSRDFQYIGLNRIESFAKIPSLWLGPPFEITRNYSQVIKGEKLSIEKLIELLKENIKGEEKLLIVFPLSFLAPQEIIPFIEKLSNHLEVQDTFSCPIITAFNFLELSKEIIINLIIFYSGLIVEVEEKAVFFASLPSLTLRDEFTGIYTEKYLKERLQEEIYRSKRFQRMCSLILLTPRSQKISNSLEFKSKFIKKFASLLTSNLRKVDIVSLFDKNQFAILMPETSKKRAISIGERLITAFQLDKDLATDIVIKVSVVNYPLDGSDFVTLINKLKEVLQLANLSDKSGVYYLKNEFGLIPD